MGPELEVPGYGCEDHFNELDTVEHSWEVLAVRSELLQRTTACLARRMRFIAGGMGCWLMHARHALVLGTAGHFWVICAEPDNLLWHWYT